MTPNSIQGGLCRRVSPESPRGGSGVNVRGYGGQNEGWRDGPAGLGFGGSRRGEGRVGRGMLQGGEQGRAEVRARAAKARPSLS